jgi:multisubunit Na+/H+ antiporter MnhB subunit
MDREAAPGRTSSPRAVPGRLALVAGIVLVSLGVALCLLLGTLGWFAVGFGTMTGCTNDYSCTETGCPPCRTTGTWINLGGVVQLLLATAGIVLLVLATRIRPHLLAAAGLALLVLSVLAFVGTTWAAQHWYCRPGTPGYEQSYCPVEP